MSRVRVDIDELRDLRVLYLRVGSTYFTIAGELKKLQGDLSGYLFQLSVQSHKASEPLRRVHPAYKPLEKLHHLLPRLSFTLGSSYSRLANDVRNQLFELARATGPDRRGIAEFGREAVNDFVANSVGALFTEAIGGWLTQKLGDPKPAYALPAPAYSGKLAERPTIAEVFTRLGTLRVGQVEVIPMSNPHGAARYLVLIRGLGPGGETPNNPLDALLASRLNWSAHSMGVLDAMCKAGIPKGSEVMLVGHSQGGITAMNLAGDKRVNAVKSPDGYVRVTHVITAGSPIGNKSVPAGTRVMAVENNADPVPNLDGREEASRTGRSVYRFGRSGTGYGNAHGLGKGYVPEMARSRFTGDPRVEKYLASAAGYLGAQSNTPQRFDLRYALDFPPRGGNGGGSW